MPTPCPPPSHGDIFSLARSMRESSSRDAVPLNLTDDQWAVLADYLQPVTLRQGQVLIEQGGSDRTVYFVEGGSLAVQDASPDAHVRVSVVGAGSVLGEGAFFSHLPRSATVHAAGTCRLWCLTPLRFRALSAQHPPIALNLAVAMAAVLGRRLHHPTRLLCVT